MIRISIQLRVHGIYLNRIRILRPAYMYKIGGCGEVVREDQTKTNGLKRGENFTSLLLLVNMPVRCHGI
jgi:hypothetical protein